MSLSYQRVWKVLMRAEPDKPSRGVAVTGSSGQARGPVQTHRIPHSGQKDLVMVNLLYQPNWTLRGPAIWLKVILGVGWGEGVSGRH